MKFEGIIPCRADARPRHIRRVGSTDSTTALCPDVTALDGVHNVQRGMCNDGRDARNAKAQTRPGSSTLDRTDTVLGVVIEHRGAAQARYSMPHLWVRRFKLIARVSARALATRYGRPQRFGIDAVRPELLSEPVGRRVVPHALSRHPFLQPSCHVRIE